MKPLLPLKAGIYRHYKGHFYQVIGYAHDANADGTVEGLWACTDPNVGVVAANQYTQRLTERYVVVYFGLQLTDAQRGPRMAVRSVDDFFAFVDPKDGSPVPEAVVVASQGSLSYIQERGYRQRFTYEGPQWLGVTDIPGVDF